MKNDRAKSYLAMIVAMSVFGSIGVCRRYIPLSSSLLVCLRGLIGALCLLIFMKFRGGKVFRGLDRRNLLLLILTGAVLGLDWMFLFESYTLTTIPVATLCFYMAPTILILVSPLLFHERLTLKKSLCALGSIAGIFLVSGMMDGVVVQPSDAKGILCGLVAALMYATVVALNKLIHVEDVYQRTFIQLFFAAVVLIPYLLFTQDFTAISLGPLAILMTLIVCVVHTGICYVLYYGSVVALPAQSVAMLSYIDPVVALILSALVLGEKLSAWGLLGAALIIGAAIISELPSKKAER